MKITDKVLSIPPYISSAWKNIVSLQLEARPFGPVLVIHLVTGSKVEIPNLERPLLEKIFSCHATVVENEKSSVGKESFSFPLIFPHLEGLASMIQHNEEHKNAPPLPSEMLERISTMIKTLLPNDISYLQHPEPGCNCPHCQIMRSALGIQEESLLEEEVTEEDLKFRTWDIKQENDKLYSVTNPLDSKEHYSIFLGNPVGCTCGNKNCEHIQAVLRS